MTPHIDKEGMHATSLLVLLNCVFNSKEIDFLDHDIMY
jgi:hypothetical protein